MPNYQTRWTATWADVFYTSAINLSATGNTGVIATPLIPASGAPAVFPIGLVAIGNNMATDETNTLTIDWYLEAAGAIAIGTTTFTQLTASVLTVVEAWPGDVAAFNAGRDLVPLFPYCKITWTLAGTTKSMGFVLYLNHLRETVV
jgi:hypothetical protein